MGVNGITSGAPKTLILRRIGRMTEYGHRSKFSESFENRVGIFHRRVERLIESFRFVHAQEMWRSEVRFSDPQIMGIVAALREEIKPIWHAQDDKQAVYLEAFDKVINLIGQLKGKFTETFIAAERARIQRENAAADRSVGQYIPFSYIAKNIKNRLGREANQVGAENHAKERIMAGIAEELKWMEEEAEALRKEVSEPSESSIGPV